MPERPALANPAHAQAPAPGHSPAARLRITFWGVQGSVPIFPSPADIHDYSRQLIAHTLATAAERLRRGITSNHELQELQRQIPLPELPFYGGETTCIEVETSEGNKLLLDAGSGLRRCALSIVNQWKDRPPDKRIIHLFGSHEHVDHRLGLTFCRFCYVNQPAPYTINVYGSYPFLQALDRHYGVFSRTVSDITYSDDPVDYKAMKAQFVGHEIRPGQGTSADGPRAWRVRDIAEPIRIGRTIIRPFEVYHVIPLCLGYKIEHDGATFVFVTDHELRRGDDSDARQRRSADAESAVREHCRNADLAYFDAQYSLAEYLGTKPLGAGPAFPRVDWGHGCVEDVIERVERCGIHHAFIGHHDPERSWTDRLDMDRQLSRICEGKPYRVQMADGDMTIEL